MKKHFWHGPGVYATKGGKISTYGTIRILHNSMVESVDDDDGLELWNKDFLPFRTGGYRVRLDSGSVKILNKKGEVVAQVSSKNISSVDTHNICIVGLDGYLFRVYKNEVLGVKRSIFYRNYLKGLRQIKRGEKPCFLDNSAFVKVPKRLKGRKLVVLEIDSINDEFKVFTKRGKLIWHQVHYPFSFAKWEPESEYARYSKK